MKALLATQPVTVGASYSSANSAAVGYESNQDAAADAAAGSVVNNNLTYTQNNNSPKALSSAEIYRQTNNQLSTIQEALPGAKPS
jgi:hypothetical protein